MRALLAWGTNQGLRNTLYLLWLGILMLIPVLISELLYSTLN